MMVRSLLLTLLLGSAMLVKQAAAQQPCTNFMQLIPRVEAIDEVCCTQPGACTSITSSMSLPATGAQCLEAACADAFIPFWDDCQEMARTMGFDAAGHDEFYTSCLETVANPRSSVSSAQLATQLTAELEPGGAAEDVRRELPAQRRTCDESAALGDSTDDAAYFGAHADARNREKSPFEPPRLSTITAEQFAEFAEAGWPVIVTDVSKDWPMHGWTCESISRKFPERRMRAEYTADPSWADAPCPAHERA